MAHHALKTDRGSVAVETLLSLPLMILFLGMLSHVYYTAQSNWRAQMLMRIAAWETMTTHRNTTPSELSGFLSRCEATSATTAVESRRIEVVPGWVSVLENSALTLTPPGPPNRWRHLRQGTQTRMTLNWGSTGIQGFSRGSVPGCTGSRSDAPMKNRDYSRAILP